MKYYIIFTHTIFTMGGGQLLTLRKARFFRDKGYNVIIVYKIKIGDFKLEGEFSEFTTIYVPEFEKPYNLLSSRNKNKIEQILRNQVKNADYKDSFIESHDMKLAVWAEYYAAKLNIPHYIYLISERNLKKIEYYPYFNFCTYKLKRNEFFACNSVGLKLSFERDYPEFQDNYLNVPYEIEEMQEHTAPAINMGSLLQGENKKFVISTISRLNKKYVEPLIKNIAEFCRENPSFNIVFFLIGDTPHVAIRDRILKEVESYNNEIGNLEIIMPGYCTPGTDFFNITDLFIGTGTAVINAISQGCITLTCSGFSERTPGIMGVDTTNFAFTENGIEYEMSKKILEVINLDAQKKIEYSNKSKQFYLNNYTLDSNWKKLMALKKKMPMDYSYYDFSKSWLFKPSDILVSLFQTLLNKLKIRIKLLLNK